MSIRIIPRLDIKGSNLVKGIHLEGLRVLGKPDAFAKYYYLSGADELLYIDAVASLYGRNSLIPLIKKTAAEIFVPLTVGGGIRSLDDIRAILCAGADKVAINTAAISNPDLLKDASRCFGSSAIVASIQAKRMADGTYEAYTDNGRCPAGLNVVQWAVKTAELGVGEILLTSIDKEGTGKGFDIELTRHVAEAVSIPIIACGGAGSEQDVIEVVNHGRADAVSMASVLHYECLESNKVELKSFSEGNLEFLRSKNTYSNVSKIRITDVKEQMLCNNILCRPTPLITVE